MNRHKNKNPNTLIIFGITGDLAKKKLLPALYHLISMGMLAKNTKIVGVTRQELQVDEFFSDLELCINEQDGLCRPEAVKKLKSVFSIQQLNTNNPKDYDKLASYLTKLEAGSKHNRLFYLSIPPEGAMEIVAILGSSKLNDKKHAKLNQLLMEKPFGHDLASAKKLIRVTHKHFNEKQIYRIDHYLAKDTVQNILSFRFNNPIFEPIWNKKYIDYIECIAEEKIDIAGRSKFYEGVGATRDFLQNHLMQILAVTLMNQPAELNAGGILKNKVSFIKSLKQISVSGVKDQAVRGQYKGYKEEVHNPNTLVETFSAMKLTSNSKKWRGVPFILKTGKALDNKKIEINVFFKPTKKQPHHNVLTFRIQPNEGIELSLRVKKPGFDHIIEKAEMDFSYGKSFEGEQQPDAYEKVIIDALKGDRTLFAGSEEIIHSWKIIDNVLKYWAKDDKNLHIYEKGSKGPDISHLYGDRR